MWVLPNWWIRIVPESFVCFHFLHRKNPAAAGNVNRGPAAARQSLSGCFALNFWPAWSRARDARSVLVFAALAEMLWRRRGLGGLPETGGKRRDGGRTNGMSKSASMIPAISRFLSAARKTGFTGFITTGCAEAGSCAAGTIDVHGTSCAFGIQFS